MTALEAARAMRAAVRSSRSDDERMLFVLVSFEGPDRYSQAGGLGVRVTGLAHALSESGYETHLFFIGDPHLPGEERRGRLTLHRWAQWISENRPDGSVYDDESGKVADLTSSLPPYLIDRLVLPAIDDGRTPIVIFEEWQTAEAACLVAEQLTELGANGKALLVWNANNPYGFDRIDWRRLSASATITAVSQYMRSIVRACGADAVVIPNGISTSALAPVPPADLERLRAAARLRPSAVFLFKMARWEREKGWSQALDAVQLLRDDDVDERTVHPVLLGRAGGPNGTGAELRRAAEDRGLRVVSFESERAFMIGVGNALREGVNVISLEFGVSPAFARLLYAFADGVLANSVSEPFGLVGLEAMAAGGLVFTGGTGEDYAINGYNAIVLESLDPREIALRCREVGDAPPLQQRIRRSARRTARKYLWPVVVDRMVQEILARANGERWHRARPMRHEKQVALSLTRERRIPDRSAGAIESSFRSFTEPRQDEHERASVQSRDALVAAIAP